MDLGLRDNVAVVAHSSPILIYESPECAGKKIELMTAAEVTGCHLLGSKTETYQRVDDLLTWARGRTVVMLDVKSSPDFPRAIETAIAAGAEDDLFLEVTTGDFNKIVVGAPGWERIHYLLRLDSPADIDGLIAEKHSQAFMYEMDPTYPDTDAVKMKMLIETKLHPAGIRSFTSTDTKSPTVANHQMLFDEGVDVVMSYDLTNGLAVRMGVNQMRGISPP